MKLVVFTLWIAALALPSYAQQTSRETSAQREPRAAASANLSEDKVEEIFIGRNLVTTLTFKTAKQVQKITLGSTAVEAAYDEELKQLELRANISEGSTNMNVVIDGRVYRFVILIVADQRKFFARTYTMAEEQDTASASRAMVESVPPMRPDQIDVNRLVSIMDRVRMDSHFRKAYTGIEVVPFGKVYAWNGSPVVLHDVSFFPEVDTLVFRIEFMNRTDKALYLHARQYRLFVANTEVPHTVRMQRTATVYPGQIDTVYLFVQGRRIDPRNNWELALPPEAEAVRRVLGVR